MNQAADREEPCELQKGEGRYRHKVGRGRTFLAKGGCSQASVTLLSGLKGSLGTTSLVLARKFQADWLTVTEAEGAIRSGMKSRCGEGT